MRIKRWQNCQDDRLKNHLLIWGEFGQQPLRGLVYLWVQKRSSEQSMGFTGSVWLALEGEARRQEVSKPRRAVDSKPAA